MKRFHCVTLQISTTPTHGKWKDHARVICSMFSSLNPVKRPVVYNALLIFHHVQHALLRVAYRALPRGGLQHKTLHVFNSTEIYYELHIWVLCCDPAVALSVKIEW